MIIITNYIGGGDQGTAQPISRAVRLLFSTTDSSDSLLSRHHIRTGWENFEMALEPHARHRFSSCRLKVKCHSTADPDLPPPPPPTLHCLMQFGASTIACTPVPCVLIIHLLQDAAPVLNKLTEHVIKARLLLLFEKEAGCCPVMLGTPGIPAFHVVPPEKCRHRCCLLMLEFLLFFFWCYKYQLRKKWVGLNRWQM